MTNAQFYVAYIIPTVLVLIGILMNRSDNQALRNELRTETQTLSNAMRAENQTLRTEMRADNHALRAEMIALRNQVHKDMVGLHERVAIVESKNTWRKLTSSTGCAQWEVSPPASG